MELLYVAIDNRKNDFIVRVLQKFCYRPGQEESSNLAGREMLERAILFATLNDDVETLEVVLKWGKENGFLDDDILLFEEQGLEKLSPILYACLKDYNKCITVLYKQGYRVRLPEEEEKTIKNVLQNNNASENDYHFYMKLWAGDRHIDQMYECLGKNRNPDSQSDPVERLLCIKAFANPHYLATEFMDENMKEEDFCLYDPVRKSLTLARYCKFLSSYYVQYSEEYLEISKVGSVMWFNFSLTKTFC